MSIQHNEKKMQSAKNDIALMLDRMKDTDKGRAFTPFIVYTDHCRLLYSGNNSGPQVRDAAFTYKTRADGRRVNPVEKAALYVQENRDKELSLRKLGNGADPESLTSLLLDYFIGENFNNNEIRRSCATAEKMRLIVFDAASREFDESVDGGVITA